jgi:tricorn protease
LLINEGNYSDGLIFPWVYKHFQLGKLIGMPVADSGSYVWWETLQDPALFFGIPEVGLQDDQGQFLERTQRSSTRTRNHGADERELKANHRP